MYSILELTTQALALPPKSRAVLADVLLDSLDDPSPMDFDRQWIKEAQRRDEEMERGLVPSKSHEDVMRHARESLR